MSNQSENSQILGPNKKRKIQQEVQSEIRDSADSNTRLGKTLQTHQGLGGSVQGMDTNIASAIDVSDKRLSDEPSFLRRVSIEELGDYYFVSDDFTVLVVAVHAVLLESGLVGFDSVSGLRVPRLSFLGKQQLSRAFTIVLSYTLPELLDKENVAESITLKFQSIGHYVNVYGTLAKGGELYRASFGEHKFAPVIDLVFSRSYERDRSYGKKGILEFWKIVKDELVLPLSIDLCDKTGLVLPTCFISLPSKLKLKILDALPANGIAKMGCVCSEMRKLSSNNDIWKLKFEKEFGDGPQEDGIINWKKQFAFRWGKRKVLEDPKKSWRYL